MTDGPILFDPNAPENASAEVEAPAMDGDFVPHNETEKLLIAGIEGDIEQEDFMRRLLTEQVFMPVEDLPPNAAPNTIPPRPLMLEDEDGHTAVALFTSPERAKPVVEHFPAYKGGFLADTVWVLERFGDRGIVLNPGWPVGLELDAGSIKAILSLNLAQRIPGQ